MAELGGQTVDFSALVSRAAEDSFLSLKELVDKSKSANLSDKEKKVSLLKYIVKTQQRMLRLNVLAKWCQQVPLIHYCQDLASTLSGHDVCFTLAADSLFFMHEGLQQARAPIYDVPSAVEVLLTGSYQRLPKCVEDVGMQSSLDEDQKKPALRKLDMLVRSKLLEVTLPKEISVVKVSNGTAMLRVDGEFKVLTTLGYRGHLSMWRILHLELLVGERSGPVKLEVSRQHVLGDDLERRMSVAENPLSILYSVLHELCVALVMDTVIRQVQALRQGRWKDAVRFELKSDGGNSQVNQEGEADSVGLKTPGLRLMYWLDADKSSAPFLNIEPGPDLQIKCVHSTFVIDPLTGKEAEFSLDTSCIDVEKLLLRAISCNRHTRLLEIKKELLKAGQICQTTDDVVLQSLLDEPGAVTNKRGSMAEALEQEEPEVLRVRAYGSSFFTLGINIRTGCFLLQSSRNTITPSILEEYEDALNQGSMSAAEVFTNLRCKSILHLFAAIGKFLGLEICEHGHAPNKLPKNLADKTSTLLLAFPDSGFSHYLLMELDKDFKPVFKVIQTQPESSGKTQIFGDLDNVVRVKEIDIEQMAIVEDELSLNIFDLTKFLSSSPNVKDSDQAAEGDRSELESSSQKTGSPSSFSSIVDEVFGLEKGTSVVTSHVQHGSVPMSPHAVNVTAKLSSLSSYNNGSLYFSSNMKGPAQSSSFGSPSLLSAKGVAPKKLLSSRSEQDLTSLTSPNLVEVCSMDDSSRLLSPSMSTGLSASLSAGKLLCESFKAAECSSLSSPLTSQVAHHDSSDEVLAKQDKKSRKRTASDLLSLVPSLQHVEGDSGTGKRRKIAESALILHSSRQTLLSSKTATGADGYSYGSLIAEANKGNAPSSVYVSVLLHVVRHCSLCIKHSRLTSQMEALDIPYVEEVGLRNSSSNLWFRLPFAYDDSWQHICLRLGRPGSMHWDVKINDQHFRDLWELQKGNDNSLWGSGVRIADSPDVDSHIQYDPEGVVLSYQSVEANSIKKLVADIRRLSNARMFALGMRKLLGIRADEKTEDCNTNLDPKESVGEKVSVEPSERLSEQMRKVFKIEAVGLTSLWFSFGSGVLARFVVEWESGKDGCTMHVSPDQLWPHTKFLEDFINGAEVASLLDCIRLTAGPLHALVAATRPARAGPATGGTGVAPTCGSIPKQLNYLQQTQTLIPAGSPASNSSQPISSASGSPGVSASGHVGHSLHGTAVLAAAGRGVPGIVPSSLLPIDVSVVLRGPYWIRIIYRKRFAVDMRCFAGDQVWLQPATPPKGGASVGGSLPCPQFRPFIMEHVAQELNGLEPNLTGGPLGNPNGSNPSSGSQLTAAVGSRANVSASNSISRVANQVAALNRVGNAVSGTSAALGVISSGLPVRRAPGAGVPAHVRGELNTAIIGLGDDGGYGGGWVPLVALKKVLRGILKYLGVLWLFAQLPELLREILGSILKENEGALLNLDQEQPALRFFVGGYVFAVSVHRVQLLLQVLSVKRFHHQQQQQQQNSSSSQEELTQSEIGEICDYFSRRVASEPYDASRVASFITLLTLPISVLREFLKLIAWKKGMSQTQGGENPPAQKPRIELCLENHTGSDKEDGSSSAAKSNIYYDRPHNSVDFALTIVLDPAHIPQINAAGGAAWLPYCVSVRLRYSFGENPSVMFLGMEGSHGGRACWLRVEDWDKCKQRVARTVEVNGSSAGDVTQGKLKVIADSLQRTLHLCLQSLREGPMTGNSG